jgi:hypothetical protein
MKRKSILIRWTHITGSGCSDTSYNVEANNQIAAERDQLHSLEDSAESFTESQYIYDFISEIENQQSELDLTEEEQLKI